MSNSCRIGGLVLAPLLLAVPAQALDWTPATIDPDFSGDDKAVADIDLDGRPDVFGGTSSGNSSDALRWWRQISPAQWEEHVIVSGGSYNFTTEMQAADIDGDGDPDAVVFDYNSVRLGYYRNPRTPAGDPTQQGQWTWQEIGAITSADAHNIYVGDVNGDGRLDVFIKGQYGGSGDAEIWVQSAPTQFVRTSLPSSSGGEGNAMGDIDNDGDLDLVTAVSSSPYCRWYENDGAGGGWTAHDGPNTGNGDLAIRVADVDGDYRSDIVVSHSENCGNVSVFSAADPRNGTWSERVVYSTTSCGWHTLQVEDVDKDGRPDILAAQMHGQVMVFYNPGRDAVGDWVSDQLATDGIHTGVLADVDRNGGLDVLGCNYDGDTPVGLRYWQSGAPPFALDAWSYLEIASSGQGNDNIQNFGLAWADVDRDGALDIVSGHHWWRNPGGDMAAAWARTAIAPDHIVCAALDVDGDASSDVIAMSTDGTQLFWYEATATDGAAWAQRKNFGSMPPTTESGYGGSQGQRVADLEPGGHLEFVIGSSDGSGGGNAGVYYFVIPADPVNASWTRKRAATASQDESFAVGDVDRDGKIDIVYYGWAGSGAGNIRWARNPGDGSADWASSEVLDLSGLGWCWSSRLQLADLDRDGRLDVVAGGECDEALWVRQPADPNSAPWAASATATIWAPSGGSHTLDVADIDRDGDVDVYVAEHQGDTALRIYPSDGAGALGSPVELYRGGDRDNHIGGLVDLDRDGDLDIVNLSWTSGDRIMVWRNDARRAAAACQSPAECNAPPACRSATGATCVDGSCVYPALDDGTACDDGNACTDPDSCDGAGSCQPGPIICTGCTDGDGDGYGDPAAGSCAHPERDCNDGDAQVNPGASERCNGINDDCDAGTDEDWPALGAVCSVGLGACAASGHNVCDGAGTVIVCDAVAGTPGSEVCTDQIDNDCDGAADRADAIDCPASDPGGPEVVTPAKVEGCACQSGGSGAAPVATLGAVLCGLLLRRIRRLPQPAIRSLKPPAKPTGLA